MTQVALTESQQEPGVGQRAIEAERRVERRLGFGGEAAPVLRDGKLIEHAGVAIVHGDVAVVILGGPVQPPEFEADVAQPFERAGSGRIQLGGTTQVAEGRLQLALFLIDPSTLQVWDDRVRDQRQRAAVGFERLEGAAGRRRLVTLGHQADELPFGGVRRVAKGSRHSHRRDQRECHERPTHEPDGSKTLTPGNFWRVTGSNWAKLAMSPRFATEELVKDAGALGWVEVAGERRR